MKVLITGIYGFAGRYLKELLENEGFEVFGITKEAEGKNVYKINLLHKNKLFSAVKEISPDIIFHLAAQTNVGISWKNPSFSFGTNFNSTLNLLEAVVSLKKKVKFYFMSSAEVYGKKDKFPIKETSALSPLNPYALSKKFGEELVNFYGKNFGIKIYIGRAFNFTGPGQRDVFVLPSFVKRLVEMEKGLREKILYTGNLDIVRDFSDVRDSVKAIYLIVKNGKTNTPYNICSGNGYRIGELLEMVLKNFNFNVKVSERKTKLRENDIPKLVGDNTKLKTQTGWEPDYTIEGTIENLVEFWRKKIG